MFCCIICPESTVQEEGISTDAYKRQKATRWQRELSVNYCMEEDEADAIED